MGWGASSSFVPFHDTQFPILTLRDCCGFLSQSFSKRLHQEGLEASSRDRKPLSLNQVRNRDCVKETRNDAATRAES